MHRMAIVMSFVHSFVRSFVIIYIFFFILNIILFPFCDHNTVRHGKILSSTVLFVFSSVLNRRVKEG